MTGVPDTAARPGSARPSRRPAGVPGVPRARAAGRPAAAALSRTRSGPRGSCRRRCLPDVYAAGHVAGQATPRPSVAREGGVWRGVRGAPPCSDPAGAEAASPWFFLRDARPWDPAQWGPRPPPAWARARLSPGGGSSCRPDRAEAGTAVSPGTRRPPHGPLSPREADAGAAGRVPDPLAHTAHAQPGWSRPSGGRGAGPGAARPTRCRPPPRAPSARLCREPVCGVAAPSVVTCEHSALRASHSPMVPPAAQSAPPRATRCRQLHGPLTHAQCR